MGSSPDLSFIRKLDGILHERSKLSIVFALQGRESLSFSELKSLLDMTDGNLSIHLRTLEEKGYVSTSRTRANGKPRKLCRLSVEGRRAYDQYLACLEDIVRASRGDRAEK